MKKIIAFLLVAVMAMSLVACSSTGSTTGDHNTDTNNETVQGIGSSNETTDAAGETTGEDISVELPAGNAATTVLRNAWAKYAAEKFFAMGGDYENMLNDNAGDVALTADYLTYSLLVPAEQTENIAEIGSLMHAMNANTFTCGAYKLAEGADETAFVTAMQTAIQGNQWTCGFPETLLVMKADGILVIAFGNGEIVGNFQTAVTAAYAEAEVVINEAIG